MSDPLRVRVSCFVVRIRLRLRLEVQLVDWDLPECLRAEIASYCHALLKLMFSSSTEYRSRRRGSAMITSSLSLSLTLTTKHLTLTLRDWEESLRLMSILPVLWLTMTEHGCLANPTIENGV